MSLEQGVGLLVVFVVLLAALGRMLRSERLRGGETGRGEDAPPRAAASPGAGDDAFAAELVHLTRRGQKIEAIRRLRERTRCGLKEAKDAVEALERGEPSPLPLGVAAPARPATPEAGLDEVVALLREGKKISAIKRYRELAGCDLKTAKDYVDGL